MSLRAELSKSRVRLMSFVVFGVATILSYRHVAGAFNAGSLGDYVYSHWVFLLSFMMLCISLILAYKEKPKRAPLSATANEYVTVVVPAYNEDPEVLRDCLRSLAIQTRPFQEIFVIDDGSTQANYEEVRVWFEGFTALHNIHLQWRRQPNGGKRSAQAIGFRESKDATIFVTVDSDSVLDQYALEELMKPFADKTVQSVAGVVLARNNRTNLLARMTDLLFVTGQMIDRSMMSSLNSVLVNSGGLAAYRADVVRANLDAYLDERFFGRHIKFSDDSMMTLFSLEKGKTVQQPTAFVFTMMPDKLSHHVRQQVRWMKGSFIRSWWRIKYLPVTSFGFLRQAIGWSQFVSTTLLLGMFFIWQPAMTKAFAPYLLLTPLVLGYVQALRYFAIKRTDESFLSQLFTYLLAPLAVLWSYFIIRPIRIYAAFTCFNSAWGTRQSVEVTLETQKVSWRSFARTRFIFESEYDRTLRAIYKRATSAAEAYELWLSHYEKLPDGKKLALWSGYEEVAQRTLEQGQHSARYIAIKSPFALRLQV